MRDRHTLRNDQWERIKDGLPGLAKRAILAEPLRITESLSRRLCGLAEPVLPGVIYRRSVGTGQTSINDL